MFWELNYMLRNVFFLCYLRQSFICKNAGITRFNGRQGDKIPWYSQTNFQTKQNRKKPCDVNEPRSIPMTSPKRNDITRLWRARGKTALSPPIAATSDPACHQFEKRLPLGRSRARLTTIFMYLRQIRNKNKNCVCFVLAT